MGLIYLMIEYIIIIYINVVYTICMHIIYNIYTYVYIYRVLYVLKRAGNFPRHIKTRNLWPRSTGYYNIGPL